MFELYKKVEKTLDCPSGAKLIEESENPFEQGPCLLCVSAQDNALRSIFGFTKKGTSMARVRVSGNDGAKISLSDMPVSFLSIKPDSNKGLSEEERLVSFVEKYFKPLFRNEDGTTISKELAMKKIRNLNIISNCDGTQRALNIIEGIKQELINCGYSNEEVSQILSQICLMSFQTEKDLSKCPASIIDFHNINDTEVNNNPYNISDDLLEGTHDSKLGEKVYFVGERKLEVLRAGEDSHEIKDYLTQGIATPVLVHTVMSSVLENAIENSRSDTLIPFEISTLFGKMEEVLEKSESGVSKEEQISEIDSKISYGGVHRLSDKELELIAQLEKTAKAYEEEHRKSEYSKGTIKKLSDEKTEMLKIAEKSSSRPTYLRILESSGWQLGLEDIEEMKAPTDKEVIENQEKEIGKLQSMLSRALKFAETVKNSVFGKIFFGKSIKQLPSKDDDDISK